MVLGPSYVPLRVISGLSAAVAAFFMFKILRTQECNTSVALTATAFYFSFQLVSFESVECRPDMLSVAFGVAALYSFVLLVRKKEPPLLQDLVLPAVLCATSIFAKQQGVVYPLAIILTLLAYRRFKTCIGFASIWLGSTAALLLTTELVSGGLLANMTLLRPVHSRSEVLLTNIAATGLDIFKLVFTVVLAPVGILMHKNISLDERLPLILFFMAAIIMCYTMGIPASNVNHLIPTLLGLCWWIGLTLRKLPSFMCVVTLAFVGLNVYQVAMEQRAIVLMEPQHKKDIAKIQALNLEGKPLLTDDVYLNLATRSKPVFVDCATFMNVWKDSGKGFDELNTKIARHEYPAIIINEPDVRSDGHTAFWPPEVIAAIKKHYMEKDILFCGPWVFVLFLPKAS